MSTLEAEMAAIVAADTTNRHEPRQRWNYILTAVIGVALVAAAAGGLWLAVKEAEARHIAMQMGTDAATVEQMAVVKVFHEFCPLKIPYVLRRAGAIYESSNPVGKYEIKIRRDIANSPAVAGTVRYVACPAAQAMVDATALGYLQ
jgi:hypothetical protein